MGGQLVRGEDLRRLCEQIKAGELSDWREIHQVYDSLWREYPKAKQRHAMGVLLEILGEERLSAETWNAALDEAVQIQEYIRDQVYISRKKDYENPFRNTTFVDDAERQAVVGDVEDNSFVRQVREETEAYRRRIESVRARG